MAPWHAFPRLRDLLRPATWADAVAILSFLAPLTGEASGFPRVLRTLRLLQTYQLLSRLRADSAGSGETKSWHWPSINGPQSPAELTRL